MENTRSHERILIVDDVLALTFIVENILEQAGFLNYHSYENPLEALEDVKSNNEVAMIISDYKMPEMTGVELLSKAIAINGQIKGLIVSATPEDVKSGHEYAVLEKGAELHDKLISYVNEALADHSILR